MQEYLDSPFPASLILNLPYPFKHVQTNVILGHTFKLPHYAQMVPFYRWLPNVYKVIDLLATEDKWYMLWHGYTPVVVADFAYISSHSFTSWLLFKRKWAIRERLRFVEDNQKAAQECLLRLVANLVAHPFRMVAVRCMAQLASKETVYR